MSLTQVQQIFSVDFIKQLNELLINGNYGDFITCRDSVKIVEYFREHNPELLIKISTNASGQPKIWERLAELGVRVLFRIDGLADTHKLYRQYTDFDLIISNAQKFIAAGGHAEWHMIDFDFNEHQRDDALLMSIKLGFKNFESIDAGRNNTPVFTRDGKYSHTIGVPNLPKDLYHYYQTYRDQLKRENKSIYVNREAKPINCYAKQKKEIYVSANGEVSPCCWTGFYPRTNMHKLGNDQLLDCLGEDNNNSLEVGLPKSIHWFKNLEKSFNISEVTEGRPFICNETCGNRNDFN
jgi:sulfatase maturation enzyme AslB (radical SAM superfamily)